MEAIIDEMENEVLKIESLELRSKEFDSRKMRSEIEKLQIGLEMLVLSKSEELKRKADLERICNTMSEIIKLNLNEVNQARKQGAEANCEDVFELFEILVNEIEADLLQGGKHVVDIWRIEGKIKFAFTELEKLNLNNDEDKSKKGNLIKVLSTMHEINKVNFEETRKNEQKVYSQPVFNIKVSKRKPSDMGQMGPKMTLGTLKMNGNDFPGV